MHSTQVTEHTELSGLRVVVVGTGASGMQMVPVIAPDVASLTIFQRSPAWVVPVPGYHDLLPPEVLWLSANMPYYANWLRFFAEWMTSGQGFWKIFATDPDWQEPNTVSEINFKARNELVAYLEDKLSERADLRAKCLPDYPPFAKRFVVDNGWFDTLLQDNVELVTLDIDHFTDTSLVSADGTEYEADVVIFATGFRANEYFWPIDIVGRNGMDFGQLWEKDGARAFMGIAMPGFPNYFCLYGPNTQPRVNGPVPWGEMQTRYVLQCFDAMIANDWDALEVKEESFQSYNEELDEHLASTVWLDKRVRSFYKNEFGRSAIMAPWGGYEYWRRTRNANLEDYKST